MRLIFDHADEISLRLSDMRDERKASERHLPADERRQSFIPGDDPLELTPVAEPLIDGGQDRTADEIAQDSTDLLLPLGLAGAAVLGIGCAELLARAATAAGAWWVS